MSHKTNIHKGLKEIAFTMLEYIRERGHAYSNGWVPATHIKDELDLKVLCYPRDGIQHGKQGWLFSILARLLEDEGVLEYKLVGRNAYYRAIGEAGERVA